MITYPTDISGCFLWLKADDLALSDGDAVASWTDLSGSGNNFTQSTASNKPTYLTNCFGSNNYSCVQFDGSNDYMTASYSSSMDIGTQFCSFVVYKHSDYTNRQLYAYDSNTAATINYALSTNPTASGWKARSKQGGGFDQSVTQTLAHPSGTIYIRTDRLIGNRLVFRRNGVIQGSGSFSIAGIHPLNTFKLGTSEIEGLSTFKGEIGEMVLYHRNLSDSEVADVESYLTQRYFSATAGLNLYLNATPEGTGNITTGMNLYTHGFVSGNVGAINFHIWGDYCSTAFHQIVDNLSAGRHYYQELQGNWFNTTYSVYNSPYSLSGRFVNAGTGVAKFHFSDILPGDYDIFTHWNAAVQRTTNANYIVIDGSTVKGTVNGVNQQNVPGGQAYDGYQWYWLGRYSLNSDSLDILVSGQNADFAGSRGMVADAMRISSYNCRPGTGINLYIEGSLTSFSGGIPLYTHGTTLPSYSGNLPLFMYAGTSGIYSTIPFYIKGVSFQQGMPLYLKTAEFGTSTASIPLYLTSSLSGISNNLDLFLYNDVQNSGRNLRLFIEGIGRSEAGIPLFMGKGVGDGINFYMNGYTTATSSIPLYLFGGYTVQSGIDLFMEGSESAWVGSLSGNIPLYISGPLTITSGLPLYIGGYPLIESNLELYTHGGI